MQQGRGGGGECGREKWVGQGKAATVTNKVITKVLLLILTAKCNLTGGVSTAKHRKAYDATGQNVN